MEYNGIASANIEGFRGVGHSLVDNSLDDARVVGVRGHRTETIYTTRAQCLVCGTRIARQPGDGETRTQPRADVVGSKNKV